MKRIALFGGSFNPPGEHHAEVIRGLVGMFDRIIVAPCGPRPDKSATNAVSPALRARMARLAFGPVPGITLLLDDLTRDRFSSNHELGVRFGGEGEVWHVIGSDLIQRTAGGKSVIEAGWDRGEELWRAGAFCVVRRAGYEVREANLPLRHRIIEARGSGSSSEIRRRIAAGEPVTGLLAPEVERLIRDEGLYRKDDPARDETERLKENAGREACSRPAAGWSLCG